MMTPSKKYEITFLLELDVGLLLLLLLAVIFQLTKITFSRQMMRVRVDFLP